MIQPNTMDATNKYFQAIDTFTLPAALLDETLAALRAEGQLRVESLVFWAGSVQNGAATVTHVVVPKGDGVFKHPLQVRIDENVLAAVCDLVDPPRLLLLGQVHTHLGDAFHSPTDDRFSLDTPGYLSIVIPNFARDDAALWHLWAFYECQGGGRFRPIDGAERAYRFIVAPHRTVTVHDVHA